MNHPDLPRATRWWRAALMGTTALPLMFALTGCGFSKEPVGVFLSLPLEMSTASPSASDPQPGRPLPLLAVRRVQIPEYLHSTRVRYRDSAETLAEWPGIRWAERLEVSLTRQLSLALNLVTRPGTACDDNCASAPTLGSLQVSYLTLDHVRSAGQLHAQVNWRLTPSAGSSAVPRLGQLTLMERVQPDSAAGQAAAMARLNTQVARQIAAALQP